MREIIVTMHLLTYYQLLVIGTGAIVWGIILLRRKQLFDDGYKAVLYAVFGTGLMQIVYGGILYLFFGCRPNNMLHLVYGLIVIAAIPVAFTYSSESLAERRDLFIFTFTAFAIVAAGLRAFGTGMGGYCPA